MKPLIGTQRSRVQTEALEDRGGYITMSKAIAALENVSREIRQMALAMHEMNHTRTSEIVKALEKIERKLTIVPASSTVFTKDLPFPRPAVETLPFCKLGGYTNQGVFFCPLHGQGHCQNIQG